MALPASYTEATLGAFMHTELGPVATTLGWTYAGGSYGEALNEVSALAGGMAITDMSALKARALARVAVWRQVVNHTAGDYTFQADGGTFNRKEFHDNARARMLQVETDAAAEGFLGGAYKVASESLTYVNDPYHVVLDDPNYTGIQGPVVLDNAETL